MKYAAPLFFIFALGACSTAQNQQARETADEAKRETKEALKKAEVETKKLSIDVDKDMDKARAKTREALGVTDGDAKRQQPPATDKPRP